MQHLLGHIFLLCLDKLIAKAFDLVNSLWILIRRSREVDSVSKTKTAFIHAHIVMKVAVFDFVNGARMHACDIRHLLCVHLKPVVSGEGALMLARDLAD